MGWTVIREDFENNELEKLDDEFRIKDNNILTTESFKVLKYLDPYDDSTFNSKMCFDLKDDLQKIADLQLADKEQIQTIIRMADICMDEPHTYLKFYGD